MVNYVKYINKLILSVDFNKYVLMNKFLHLPALIFSLNFELLDNNCFITGNQTVKFLAFDVNCNHLQLNVKRKRLLKGRNDSYCNVYISFTKLFINKQLIIYLPQIYKFQYESDVYLND